MSKGELGYHRLNTNPLIRDRPTYIRHHVLRIRTYDDTDVYIYVHYMARWHVYILLLYWHFTRTLTLWSCVACIFFSYDAHRDDSVLARSFNRSFVGHSVNANAQR